MFFFITSIQHPWKHFRPKSSRSLALWPGKRKFAGYVLIDVKYEVKTFLLNRELAFHGIPL